MQVIFVLKSLKEFLRPLILVSNLNVQCTYAAEALFKYRINNVTEILLVVFDVQNPKSQISEF